MVSSLLRKSQSCTICGESSSSSQVVFRQILLDHVTLESFPLVECLNCRGHFFLSEIPADLSKYYSNALGSSMHQKPSRFFEFLRRFLLRRELKYLINALRQNFGAQQPIVLDIGAGDGFLCQELQAYGVKTWAWDFYPVAQWPKHQGPYTSVNLQNPEAVQSALVPLKGRPIFVVMRHLLEHVVRPHDFLQLFNELDVRGFLIVLPNSQSWLQKIFKSNWYHWDPPRHLSCFSPDSLKKLFLALGYQAKKVQTYGIDEVIMSLMRRRSIQLRDHGARFQNHKNPWVALSSAFSYLFFNTVIRAWFVREKLH